MLKFKGIVSSKRSSRIQDLQQNSEALYQVRIFMKKQIRYIRPVLWKVSVPRRMICGNGSGPGGNQNGAINCNPGGVAKFNDDNARACAGGAGRAEYCYYGNGDTTNLDRACISGTNTATIKYGFSGCHFGTGGN